MKTTDCGHCGGTGRVRACDSCLEPSLGRCVMCHKQTCSRHGGDLYGTILCTLCFQTATVDQVDRAAKVRA